jgi:predicted O-linked N-acetylglucosamine transferase (SPINDLY family)/SAM-dependent methyltransferase
MTIEPGQLERLLELINGGSAAQAIPELDQLLLRMPGHPGLLMLKGEALRLAGRRAEAVETLKAAGNAGAGARNWLAAGVLLAGERKTDEALECLHKARAESPDNPEILDALVTTLFNSNRHREAVDYARQQLALSQQPTYMTRAALLLQGSDFYEESSNAFKKIIELAPDDPAVVGSALVPARFTCDWEWIEFLQGKISTWYERGDFGAPQEYPLTHLTWCGDEARNLGVTRAYVARMVPQGTPLPLDTTRNPGERLRVGYLSCDFRNHATMHLMAGVFECHDRQRFEVFAYDYSSSDISEYRQRFLDAVEHHVPIHSMGDDEAAARMAADRLDILFDLKLYTGGGRPGVLSFRPAPVQAAYIGFPGSAANSPVDYVVSDRFVTPDSSTPYYIEKFCRLPHSYQCNDHKRFAASEPASRGTYGLPDDKVVFGAFNQSYKIDRTSFTVWLRVLAEVPESVLWLLGQNETAIANLTRYAQLAGIDPARLIFAPFAQPRDHLTRLRAADAILDTLVCNGHTTTSDALWAGVPVITAHGTHFASRVSESLLNAMELPELVGADRDDMVRIAKRVGMDAGYRAALREKVAAKRLSAPLFDTLRFTRNFEAALEMMIDRQRSGAPLAHIDVPDRGPVDIANAPTLRVAAAPSRFEVYASCPLCNGTSVTLGFSSCTQHPLWHEPIPPTLEWLRCPACSHVHTRSHWTKPGLLELRRTASAVTPAASSASLAAERATWAPVVGRVVGLLGGYRAVVGKETRPIWVDVGCGDGALIMTAMDYGFAAVGLDTRAEAVSRIQALGFNALQHDYTELKFEVVVDVLSLMDTLEQIAYPRAALEKAAQILRPGGVLVLSTPDLTSSVWKAMDVEQTNPYWMDLERYHNFSRDRIVGLLNDSGFEVVDFAIPARSKAQIELYAVRK